MIDKIEKIKRLPARRKWTKNFIYDVVHRTTAVGLFGFSLFTFSLCVVTIGGFFVADKPKYIEDQREKEMNRLSLEQAEQEKAREKLATS